MSIDVVIVNWNSGKLLFDCIESIIEYGKPYVSKVFIIDNGSSDDSEKFLQNLPQFNLIQANKNLGFSKACNLGADQSESEFILFLNPDARIYADTLEKVLAFMETEENSKVGICGVQLHNEKGEVARSSSRFPSLKGILSHSIGLSKMFPILGSAMSEWDHLNTNTVDQVIGAFFFVRQSTFQELTGFDEQFFVYFEEVDFSFRAKQLGWNSVFFVGAQAFHVGGGISQQVKSNRLFYTMRSRIQYAFKHFKLIKITLILFATIFIEPISRIIFSIFRRSLTSIKETLIAYSMLYKWLVLSILKK